MRYQELNETGATTGKMQPVQVYIITGTGNNDVPDLTQPTFDNVG